MALNATFSAFAAVMIFEIGKRRFGRTVALIAGWAWACWLYEIVVSVRLWESGLSGLLLLVGLWMLSKLPFAKRHVDWLMFGMVAGVSALSNTTLLPVFAGFWVWLWAEGRRRQTLFWRSWLASIAVCVFVLLPWTIRNYVTFHRLIPVRDNLGLELWIGNHEGVAHLYDFRGSFPLNDPTEYNRLGELPFMEVKRHEALEFIHHHPGRFIKLCSQRVVDFWIEPKRSLWWMISLAAWIGLALALKQKGFEALPEGIIMIVFPAIYYITHPWSTYRHPIEPVVLLLAAYALTELGRKLGIGAKPAVA